MSDPPKKPPKPADGFVTGEMPIVKDMGPSFDPDSVRLPPGTTAEFQSPFPAPARRPPPPKRSVAPFIAGGLFVFGVGTLVVALATRKPPESAAPDASVVAEAAPPPAADPAPPKPMAVPPPPPPPAPPATPPPAPAPEPTPEPEPKPRKRAAGDPNLDEKAEEALNRLAAVATADAGVAPPPEPEKELSDEAAVAACDGGDAAACVKAGEFYERSTRDDGGAKARAAYEKACDGDRAAGCKRFARLLTRGIGGPVDPARAEAMSARACRLGDKPSCLDPAKTSSVTRVTD